LVSLLLSASAYAAVRPENVRYEPQRNMSLETELQVKSLRYMDLAPKDAIRDLIDRVTGAWVTEHVEMLSGEHDRSSQFTRQSLSTGPNTIGSSIQYVSQQMEGYGFQVSTHQYQTGYAPNVISVLPGTTRPNELVIIGAHLDDIPNNGRAPGANDDASGSAANLAIAQALAASGIRFERTIVIEYYTGEEQGLVGSRALARERSQRGDTVTAQLQSDMTGYRRAGDPIAVAFVQDARAVDLVLTQTCIDLARNYAASDLTILNQVTSGSSCCSDHQSYRENGYPSVGYIEMRGYTGDPQYHQAGDLVRRADYSTNQVALAARVTLAAAATLAIPS